MQLTPLETDVNEKCSTLDCINRVGFHMLGGTKGSYYCHRCAAKIEAHTKKQN